MPHRTLIIIPAFNEAAGIGAVLASLRTAGQPPVLVVDDGSTDDTAAIARAAGASVVRHPFNMGYGSALRTGYRFAVRRGYDAAIQFDGDGQHDAGSLAAVQAALEEGYDLVLGSRFRDRRSYTPPPLRRFGIALFSLLASWSLGRRITDAATGFQGLSRRLMDFYDTAGQFPHDYPDANLIIRAARAGFRVREVAVRMHAAARGGGMHAGLKPLWYGVKMGLAVTVEATRRLPHGEA